jgi:NAD(P)-dependent dehydrogenase (short-subunit alcohol dehydrogenase family)
LLTAVIAHFGQAPDLIVNNASLFEFDDRASASLENLERHMRVNMMAPTRLTLGLAGALAVGERAAVVNIIDQRIRNPIGDQLSYTLSKQALAESVRTLARACADRLRVNGVAPGLTIATPDYDDDQMQRLTAAMPLHHLPRPDDVAGAVLYLAGADSVTGQTIFVDGGAHMKSFDRDFLFMEKD